jgi:hypothetical protein
MGDVKPWQIVVLVVATVALGASLFFTFGRSGPRVQLASTMIMADVTTGELFEFSISGRRGMTVPGLNPDSGRFLLLPVERNDSGGWVINERARGLLSDLEAEPAAVDRKTGEVQVSGRPRRVR